MKKLASTLMVCMCLGASVVGAPAASAASTTEIQETGGVDLDPYINRMEIKESTESTSKRFNSSLTKVSAGGGEFWVTWGADRHWSNYNHPSKTHRSSASNKYKTERSDWMSPGDLASVWVKSTLTGNKANWATK